VRCSALQCVAVRYSALQCIAVFCRVLQCVEVCCSVLRSLQYNACDRLNLAQRNHIQHHLYWLCTRVRHDAFRWALLQNSVSFIGLFCRDTGIFHREADVLCYGVATVSRINKSVGLFCRIASLLQGSFAKETYNFDLSHLR